MASLFVIKGPDQGKRFDVTARSQTLGRDATNPIRLHDTEVSRRHVELRRTDDGFELIDLESSNGTFVNDERTQLTPLVTGDRVQVGRTVLLFTVQTELPQDDLSAAIDIIGSAAESRILSSMSHDESSDIFGGSSVGSAAGGKAQWLARARSNLQVMYRTALAVSHKEDIDDLLNRILDLIFEWVEADRGCVMLVDQQTEELTPKARRTREGVDAEEKITISQTILDDVMQRQEGVVTSDTRDDDRWDTAASIVKLGVREAICVPMQGRYGIVGVIYIDTFTPPGQMLQNRSGNRLSEEHLRLMVAIGHQAALAVEDTSFYSAMVQSERLAAMGQTIAALSHHIKNILQGIRSGSYLIEEGLKNDDRELLSGGWRIVEKNQDKISNLVMDMLTFSKEREPDPVPSQLNEVAADVIELMAIRATEEDVTLKFEPDESMPSLTFDPEALHRAVLNVVTNAIDVCRDRHREYDEEGDAPAPPPSQVTVSTAYDASHSKARLTVEDNGSGIAPDELNRIFKMFASTKGQRGTGLGLPVSQKILQEHGGDILVESTPGQGSRFILEFPATLPSAEDSSLRPTMVADSDVTRDYEPS